MARSTDTAQMKFGLEFSFVSACVHCGKQMARMDIDRFESVGPGQVEERRVYRVWIDPEHDCTHLSIDAKDKAISA